ncbi:hypothetical protein [Aneurinibacillus migulanus]|nr:hypothetical protein [Aneurinibacillus migulanus]
MIIQRGKDTNNEARTGLFVSLPEQEASTTTFCTGDESTPIWDWLK